MNYKLENGKTVVIKDEEIDNLCEKLDISIQDAIQVWLEDHDYAVNEEVEALTKKAKENHITAYIHDASKLEGNNRGRNRTPDDDKRMLVNMLADALKNAGIAANITNIEKIIEFDYNDNHYKLDLVKQRKKK